MNVYFSQGEARRPVEDILKAAQTSIQDLYRGFVLKPLDSIPAKTDQEFFYEGPSVMIAGKVFTRPFGVLDYETLIEEFSGLAHSSEDEIMVYVFVPSILHEFRKGLSLRLSNRSLETVKYKIRIFEYAFLQSPDQAAACLHEFVPKIEENAAMVESKPFNILPNDYDPGLMEQSSREERVPTEGFFRRGRLSTEELQDLSDLILLSFQET